MSASAEGAQDPAARQSFQRAARLSKTDEFSSVFAFRRSLRSEHFQLLYRPAGFDAARLGVVVAKKLVGRAVDRNLLKRLAREAFRMKRVLVPAHDLVLRLSSAPTAWDKSAIRAEIDGLLGGLPK